jgi:hypothetical protein
MIARPFRSTCVRLLCSAGLVVTVVVPARAQTQVPPPAAPVALSADVLFYGDNTEFHNDYREGETLLGESFRAALVADLGGHATVTGGVLADQRDGADSALQLVRPLVRLEFGSTMSRFVFGTLLQEAQPAEGPDREGPHGLLPPIQRDTLAYERPYEAGVQWVYRGRSHQELWIDWQHLNTPTRREEFDAGLVGRVPVVGPVSALYQFHVVHHGGQLFSSGAVADSYAGAPGAAVSLGKGRLTAAIEAYAVLSRYVPDRALPMLRQDGSGAFVRGEVSDGPWRAHAIVWRGKDYIKEEGDANYGSVTLTGERVPGTRRYAEVGLTRVAKLTPLFQVEGSFRVHVIDGEVDYSYRMLGHLSLLYPLRRAPAPIPGP